MGADILDNDQVAQFVPASPEDEPVLTARLALPEDPVKEDSGTNNSKAIRPQPMQGHGTLRNARPSSQNKAILCGKAPCGKAPSGIVGLARGRGHFPEAAQPTTLLIQGIGTKGRPLTPPSDGARIDCDVFPNHRIAAVTTKELGNAMPVD